MGHEIYSIFYADKDAAKLIYREIVKNAHELGIVAHGLETYKTPSRRSRSHVKLFIVLSKDNSPNLTSILKGVQHSLVSHRLYEYISFNYTAKPISKTLWDFDSYDEKNYQDIFIRKRRNS